MQRRLQAVLAGAFSAHRPLRAAEEAPAETALNNLRRQLVSPAVARHGGRLVHMTLDGFLVVFPSVIAAARAAAEIQRDSAQHQAAFAATCGPFGLALNLGDLVVDGRDVYGDAIGIAERAAPLAGATGILATAGFLTLLGNRVTGLKSAGAVVSSRETKDLPEGTVRLDYTGYEEEPAPWQPVWAAGGHPWLRRVAMAAALLVVLGTAVGGGWWAFRRVPPPKLETAVVADAFPVVSQLSLVVLPFANEGGDPDQDYIADGLTQDLTSSLSRAVGSFVISPSTSFTYKGSKAAVVDIARELSVRYVVVGDVKPSREAITVSVAITDAPKGREVWTERREVPLSEFGQFHAGLVQRIAGALSLIYVQEDTNRSLTDDLYDPRAVDLIYRGTYALMRARGPSDLEQSEKDFREALKLDHRLSKAWAGLGSALARKARGSDTRDRDLYEALSAADSALLFDPGNATAHEIKGYVLYERGRISEALAEYDLTIRNDRNRASAYAQIGALSVLVGQAEKGVAAVEQAITLSPRDPAMAIWQNFLGIAALHVGQYEKAVEALRQSISMDPRNAYGTLFLAAAYAMTGAEAEARLALSEALRLAPGLTIRRLRQLEPSRDPVFVEQRRKIYEGLMLAGMAE